MSNIDWRPEEDLGALGWVRRIWDLGNMELGSMISLGLNSAPTRVLIYDISSETCLDFGGSEYRLDRSIFEGMKSVEL